MNKKRIFQIPVWIMLPLLLLIVGVSIISYPRMKQVAYRSNVREMIKSYDLQVEKIEAESHERLEQLYNDPLEQLYHDIVSYNKMLYTSEQQGFIKANSYEETDFSLKSYGFEEEMIGYISIPKMDVNLPVYLGASRENLKLGAAQLTQTSIPVGGENTNAVIAAHRGMSTAAMFRDIEKLEVGDKVYITNFRETLTYTVCQTKVIKPTDFEEVMIQAGKDMVTLITCHPYRFNYSRYAVYCERADK